VVGVAILEQALEIGLIIWEAVAIRILFIPVIALHFACSVNAYDGKGELNLVVVGEQHQLKAIKEIKDFFGMAVEGQRDVSYVLTLDSNAWPNDPQVIWAPVLVLRSGGEVVASAILNEQRDEKAQELTFQWTAVPQFDEDSYFRIQMYPNTEKMAMLQVPLSTAKLWSVSKDRKRRATTISELREQAVNRKLSLEATNKKRN